MNEFNKITVGFVIQNYTTLPNGTTVCTEQEFIAGDQVDYETTGGAPIEVDTDKEVYCPMDMVQPKQIPVVENEPASEIKADGLPFVCPDCGGMRLECCEDGPYCSEVTNIDEDGDFDYAEIEASGTVDRYQCLNCGFTLSREDGSSIDDNEEVVEWIKENCK